MPKSIFHKIDCVLPRYNSCLLTIFSKMTCAFLTPLPLPTSAGHFSSALSSRRGRTLPANVRVNSGSRSRCREVIRQTLTQAPTTETEGSTKGDIETDALIVGGGISGTSLAFNLSKQFPSVNILLTESRAVVGGNVISRQENGYTWEEGPNTYQPAAHIMRLAVDVGLKDDIVFADSTLPRFVYWDDVLYALPMGPKDIPKFRLLSPWGFIRAGLGAMGLVLPYFGKDESVKQFISRHLGKEVFMKMIDPFVSGVYAGDPSKLCMSAAFKKIFALQNLGGTQGIIEGAIIRLGQRKREAKPLDPDLPTWKSGALGSFRNGLVSLPKAIADKLGDSVKLEWKMTALEALNDGRYRATYETPDGRLSVVAKAIAITAPARAAASILNHIAPGTKRYEDIHYPSVWSVSLAYPKGEFKEPLRGFGNLIPRSMGVRTLGTIWSSCLFPGRAPEGMELLLSYIGGAQDPGIKDLTAEQVVNIVDKDIKKLLMREGCDVKPVVLCARLWERAIPQYNIGYWDIMEEAQTSLAEHDGIFVGGNFVSGVAFGDCVLWGADTASKVANFVDKFATTAARKD